MTCSSPFPASPIAMVQLLYIETVGCQMNMLDSEMVVASLRRQGYEITSDIKQADTILFNTCSVRQHAEDKIYSALGKLRDWKEQHPDKVIGVLGCMAQKVQQKIFRRAPYVDLIVGPGQLQQVPDLIEQARQGEQQLVAVSRDRQDGTLADVKRSHETFDPLRDPTMRSTPFQAYLRIQIGCDKFCTYCVVPMTRGPEQGRPPAQILQEARVLAGQGCQEIILLGQTVNSYHYQGEDSDWRLADLLEELQEVDGIQRIKFVTNYPRDMDRRLLETVRDLPKCSPYLHVPLQSGSDAVLQRMRRGYSVDEYRQMMERIHQILPEAAVASDFIVGFCGETEEEFQLSVETLREFRFKNSFIFKYSEREGTKAMEQLPDDVPYDVKQRRNNLLLEIQNEISEQENQRFVGQTVEVLVEGQSKKSAKLGEEGPVIQLVGRTPCDRIVVFDGTRRQVGQILSVTVYDTTPHTLLGSVMTEHAGPELYLLGSS